MQASRNSSSPPDSTTAGQPRREAAWILWVLLLVAFLLSLAVIIPNFVWARSRPSQNACINNLRQIDGAKQQWALENKKDGSAVPTFSEITPYLGRGGDVVTYYTCPNGAATNTCFTSYEIGAVTNPPKCKLFPQQHFLE